jgi:hypothetical protein
LKGHGFRRHADRQNALRDEKRIGTLLTTAKRPCRSRLTVPQPRWNKPLAAQSGWNPASVRPCISLLQK